MTSERRHYLKQLPPQAPELNPGALFVSPTTVNRTVCAVTSGELTRLQDKLETGKTRSKQYHRRRSELQRTLLTLIGRPDEVSRKATDDLANHLSSYSVGTELLTSPKAQDWWTELMIGLHTRALTFHMQHTIPHNQYPELTRYRSITDAQMRDVTVLLQIMQPDQLVPFFLCSDMLLMEHIRQLSVPAKEVLTLTAAGTSSPYNSHTDILLTEFWHAQTAAWARMRSGWTWEHVLSAIQTIPALRSRGAMASISLALEENLIASDGAVLDGMPYESHVDSKPALAGILRLLRSTWGPLSEKLRDSFPLTTESVQGTVALDTVEISMRHAPPVVMSMLSALHTRMPPETFMRVVDTVHQAVVENLENIAPWIFVLLYLRRVAPESALRMNALIAETNRLPETYRAILLDQLPGSLWFTDHGLFPYKRMGSVCIHTSRAIELPTAIAIPPIPNTAPTKEPAAPVRLRTTSIPFIGTVGIPSRTMVPEVTRRHFEATRNILDADRYFDIVASLQEERWFQKERTQRPIIDLTQLNQHDALLAEAPRHHVRAVHTYAGEVLFVLDTPVSIVIRGSLDPHGWLQIRNATEAQLNESVYLFLCALALHCSRRRVQMPDEHDRSVMRAVHEQIKYWNKRLRNGLPEITLGEEGPCFLSVTVAPDHPPLLLVPKM